MPPLLHPVEESRLNALQERLESISRLSVDFLVLLAGATFIATFGLFQNSPGVIIGAMIIAPLMRPLVGLSLATLTADTKLLGRALLTLVVGTLTTILISGTLGMVFRSLELTPEILGRTQPTLLDLGVAMFAGAIGAYCQANEKLADTLAGVAIAVALVPPLSVVGIGLAFANTAVFSGAALLYVTNLIGITVSGAIVFLLMGFTPLHRAKKGLVISAVLSLLLVVPLALSMRELVLENQINANIKRILQERTHTFHDVELHDVRVERYRRPMTVSATVLSPGQPITVKQVALVQDFLIREMDMPLKFRLQVIPSMQITADGVSSDSATSSFQSQPLPSGSQTQGALLQTAPPSITPSITPSNNTNVSGTGAGSESEKSSGEEPPGSQSKSSGSQSKSAESQSQSSESQ